MRKTFSKIVSGVLSAAMVLSLGTGVMLGSTSQVASAADDEVAVGYSAYLGFQTNGPFAYRDPMMDKPTTPVADRTGYFSTQYKYETQCMLPNSKDESVVATDVNSVKQVMDKAGKYSVSISGIDLKNKYTHEEIVSKKTGEKQIKDTYCKAFNMLFITTNIPLTNKGVKCTNVELKIDGKSIKTLKVAPCKSDAAGYYQFMVADNYAADFDEKGPGAIAQGIKTREEYVGTGIYNKFKDYKDWEQVDDAEDPTFGPNALSIMPTDSIELSYEITGGNWNDLPIVGAEGKVIEVGDFKYQIMVAPTSSTPGQASLVGVSAAGLANKGTLTIPTTIKDDKVTKSSYKVIAINEGALSAATATTVDMGTWAAVPDKLCKGNKAVTTVKLGSATKIGKNAFDGCTALTAIDASKIKSIGSSAFAGCTKLSSVKFGTAITSIGTKVFTGCKALKTIKLGKNIKSIGTSAFEKCAALKTVTLGKKTSKIGSKAFASCKKLSKLAVSTKVKVTKNAFKGCKATIKVTGKAANKKATVKNIKKSGYKKVK